MAAQSGQLCCGSPQLPLPSGNLSSWVSFRCAACRQSRGEFVPAALSQQGRPNTRCCHMAKACHLLGACLAPGTGSPPGSLAEIIDRGEWRRPLHSFVCLLVCLTCYYVVYCLLHFLTQTKKEKRCDKQHRMVSWHLSFKQNYKNQ